ncbi:MAG: hypothetical protein II313_04905, partial [Anaerotignum sp.]|nr:hypothetical protein [Anaerotignum sp.]
MAHMVDGEDGSLLSTLHQLVRSGRDLERLDASCAPWLDYAAYCPVNYGGSPNLFPIITFGKYTEENGRFTMPLTLTISHACMDGYHLSVFFNGLQEKLDQF